MDKVDAVGCTGDNTDTARARERKVKEDKAKHETLMGALRAIDKMEVI